MEKGRVGESIAIRILCKAGYRILDRNWYCKHGELDIVAERGNTVVFIEVKMRTTYCPYKKINKYKLQRIRKSIYEYLNESSKEWRLEAFYIFKSSSGLNIRRVLITKSY